MQWCPLSQRRRTSVFLTIAIFLACTVAARGQVTFAGSQFDLASGQWSAPKALAIDRSGDLFIADSGNNRVVELPNSSSGFGAPLTILSGLSAPAGIAVDWAGNIYVSDTGNDRILMAPFSKEGFGSALTIASGFNSPAGLAVDSSGNIFVADAGNNCAKEVPLTSGVYGTPIIVSAGLNNPLGIAVDTSKTLYIADTGNNRVVYLPYSSGGYTAQQYYWTNQFKPASIAVDKNSNLYITDTLHHTAFEEPWAAGAKRYGNAVILGSGFASPAVLVTDLNGNFYVADSASNAVVKVITGSITFGETSVGSTASPITYNFSIAAGTTLGAVSIYMQGVVGGDFTDAGEGTCFAQTYSSLTVCGVNVNFAPSGSGSRLGAVVLTDAYGNSLSTAFISGVGVGPRIAFIPGVMTQLGTQLSGPSGVAVDGFGNVYIADTGNNRVIEVPRTGNGYGPQTTLPVAGIFDPMGLTVDGAGNLYVASNGNDRVVKLAWTGTGYGAQTRVGTGLYGPSDVGVDAGGNVYLTDTLDGRLDREPWTGNSYGVEGTLGNYHKNPVAIAVDAAGDAFFTDPYQEEVSEVPSGGSESTFRDIDVSFAAALAVDGNSNLYILDSTLNRVVMLPWNGTQYGAQITVATGFNAPTGMAVDGNGDLYIADTGNNQVVKISQSLPGAVGFANTFLGSTSADSAKVALVENLGNAAFAISAVSFPVDFPEGAGVVNPCDGDISLGRSESCELAMNFTPQSAGSPLTEEVNIAYNSLGAPGVQQQMAVSGTSLAKASQSIHFPAMPETMYGTAPITLLATASSGLPVTFQVLSGPGSLTRNGQILNVNGAGTIVVEAMQSGNLAYGAATPATVSLVVAPSPLTVTPSNTTAVYGAIPSSFGYSITGFVNHDNPGAAVHGQPTIAGGTGSKTGVGTYLINASQGTLTSANYNFVFVTGTLTVSRATLQILAVSQSRSYGSPTQALGWRLSGFVNGDAASVVTGSPVLSTSANSGSSVGSYPILVLQGTLAAANYIFTTVNGELTVTHATLQVVAASATISYGASLPALSYAISGLVNGDTATSVIRGAPAISTSATAHCPAGTYPIALSQGTLVASNYSFQFTPGVLVVQKAVLTVTAANASMTYGGAIPAFSYTVTGFISGDKAATSLKGAPAFTSNGSSRSTPGLYVITAGIGSMVSADYTFAYNSGVLTIGKALLTVIPASLSMIYGGHLPSLTYQFSGFVNGDGSSAVQGSPSLLTQVTSTSPAGIYSITGSVGTLSSQKYMFQVLKGTLTVTKAVLAVRAASLATTYGAQPPALTYALSGFVNGDTAAVVSGSPLLSSRVAGTSSAGIYPITIASGSLAAANYSFSLQNGQITVNKAVLTVTPKNQSMIYGGAFPALSYALVGLMNGDSQASATTGAPAITTTASASSPVGTYSIGSTQGTLAASNYSFRFVGASFSIAKAPLTVTANNLSMTAGGTVPALTFSTTGFVKGDTASSATTGLPVLSTSATTSSKIGTYAIVASQGSMKAANYALSFVSGTLTVNQSSGGITPKKPIGRPIP
jgi:sugar lactone lactonase YvrE